MVLVLGESQQTAKKIHSSVNIKIHIGKNSYHIMHTNVNLNASHRILLGYILPVEEFMENDHRFIEKVSILHYTR